VDREKCVHVSFERNVNFRGSTVNSFHYTAVYMLLKISGVWVAGGGGGGGGKFQRGLCPPAPGAPLPRGCGGVFFF